MSDHRKQREKKTGGAGIGTALLAVVLFLGVLFLIFVLRKEPSAETGTVLSSGTRYSATEAETGEQQLIVIRETEETEAPPKYTENETTRLISKEAGEDLSFCFAGDILFDSHYAVMASLLARGNGTPEAEDGFDEALLGLMRGADVFMVNNEFPYSLRGEALKEKQFTFRADPEYVSLLSDMGADIVALANNHLYDYGEEALLDTLDTLKEAGMPFVGAGRNLEEASRPFYFTNGEVKVGIVSATQIERLSSPDTKGATESEAGVFRCLNTENLEKTIASMKEECDFVIAYLHWGTESTEVIDDHQRTLEKAVLAAGADLVIGDHPHVLQGIAVREGVPVCYSLGNYLFNSGAQDTCLVEATVDGETGNLKALQFIPARQEGCRTRLLSGEEKERVLSHMREISQARIDEEGFISLGE